MLKGALFRVEAALALMKTTSTNTYRHTKPIENILFVSSSNDDDPQSSCDMSTRVSRLSCLLPEDPFCIQPYRCSETNQTGKAVMLYINQEDGKKKVVFCKDAREVSLDNLVSAASRPGRFVRAGPSFNHPEHVRCICIRGGSKIHSCYF